MYTHIWCIYTHIWCKYIASWLPQQKKTRKSSSFPVKKTARNVCHWEVLELKIPRVSGRFWRAKPRAPKTRKITIRWWFFTHQAIFSKNMLRTSKLEKNSSSRSENEKKMAEKPSPRAPTDNPFLWTLGFFPRFLWSWGTETWCPRHIFWDLVVAICIQIKLGDHVLPPERDRDSEGINKVSRATAIASFFWEALSDKESYQACWNIICSTSSWYV